MGGDFRPVGKYIYGWLPFARLVFNLPVRCDHYIVLSSARKMVQLVVLQIVMLQLEELQLVVLQIFMLQLVLLQLVVLQLEL